MSNMQFGLRVVLSSSPASPHVNASFQPERCQRPGPVICFQTSHVKIVIPASSAARSGPIKHAVDKRALCLSSERVQLTLPLSSTLSCWKDFYSQGAQMLQLNDVFFKEPSNKGGFDLQDFEWMLNPEDAAHLLCIGSSCRNEHYDVSQKDDVPCKVDGNAPQGNAVQEDEVEPEEEMPHPQVTSSLKAF